MKSILSKVAGSSIFKIAIGYLLILAFIGLCSPILTGPGSLIPFNPSEITEQSQIYQAPMFKEKGGAIHYLGTDQLGRDMTSRLIHGIPTALILGILASSLALIISVVLGGLSGWYGNYGSQINLYALVCFALAVLLMHFYLREWSWRADDSGRVDLDITRYFIGMITGMCICAFLIQKSFSKIRFMVYLPLDSIVLRLLELFKAIPRLFIYLGIFAIVNKPDLFQVSMIIGLMSWPTMTRILRSEIQQTKGLPYISAAAISGTSEFRLFFRHLLPNAISPLIIATAYNIPSAILIESALSFLQIGLNDDYVSWGRMLGESRNNIGAWWMAIFPGLLIFSTVLAFNVIADHINDRRFAKDL